MSRPTRGFSLVELLVAMVLGVVLIGGATTVFHGNLRSAELGQSIASMQAGARFALDEISRDLRAAGYRGCTSSGRGNRGAAGRLEVETLDTPLDVDDVERTAVFGARIEADGWKPSLPPGYAAPSGVAAPVVGTDALLVQYGMMPGEPLLADMDGVGGALRVSGTVGELEVGDLALVADCTGADLLRIGTRSGAAGSVDLSPDRSLSRRYTRDAIYPLGTPRVMPFVSAIYYVGDTARLNRAGDRVRALYVQTFPYTAANPPLELVEGVDQLQLSFGQRDDAGDLRFVAANEGAFEPERVTAVRVGLLVGSLDRLVGNGAVRTFSLVGREVLPAGASGGAGAVFYPDDERLRMAFERSVTVRNRALAEPSS